MYKKKNQSRSFFKKNKKIHCFGTLVQAKYGPVQAGKLGIGRYFERNEHLLGYLCVPVYDRYRQVQYWIDNFESIQPKIN